MPQRDRLFIGIEQTVIATTQGDFQLPILYRDGSMLALGYRVEPRLTRGFLADLPLDAVTVFGKALVLLCVMKYRDTTIGPYNELIISVLARRTNTSPSLLRFLRDPRGVEEMGWYVAALPVDSKDAYTAGVELWGYPKYVTKIDTVFRPKEVRSTLAGEFTISHSQGFGLSAKCMPLASYTVRDRHLLRTCAEVDNRVRFGGSKTVRIEVHGDGPSARVVRSLGLDSQHPMLAFRTDSLRSVLPHGKDLGAIGQAFSKRVESAGEGGRTCARLKFEWSEWMRSSNAGVSSRRRRIGAMPFHPVW